eukprot:245726-Alexandrium_andersonii.AAC.1
MRSTPCSTQWATRPARWGDQPAGARAAAAGPPRGAAAEGPARPRSGSGAGSCAPGPAGCQGAAGAAIRRGGRATPNSCAISRRNCRRTAGE